MSAVNTDLPRSVFDTVSISALFAYLTPSTSICRTATIGEAKIIIARIAIATNEDPTIKIFFLFGTPRNAISRLNQFTVRRLADNSDHEAALPTTDGSSSVTASEPASTSSSIIAIRVDVGARCTDCDMVSAGKSSSVTMRKSSSTITTRSLFAVTSGCGRSMVISRVVSRPNASANSSKTSADTSASTMRTTFPSSTDSGIDASTGSTTTAFVNTCSRRIVDTPNSESLFNKSTTSGSVSSSNPTKRISLRSA